MYLAGGKMLVVLESALYVEGIFALRISLVLQTLYNMFPAQCLIIPGERGGGVENCAAVIKIRRQRVIVDRNYAIFAATFNYLRFRASPALISRAAFPAERGGGGGGGGFPEVEKTFKYSQKVRKQRAKGADKMSRAPFPSRFASSSAR